MKRLIPLLLLIAIIMMLSSTSNLKVIEPSSWTNNTQYEENVTNINFIFDKESTFYAPYDSTVIIEKNFIMHKIAHITFYGLLGVLMYKNVKKLKHKYIYSIFLVMIVAIIDEINQYFVVGRSGRAIDVLLDTTAAIISLSLIYLYKKRTNPQKHIIQQ